MSLDPDKLQAVLSPAVVVAPPRRGRFGWMIAVALLVVAGAGTAWAWENGFRVDRLWREPAPDLALLDVDEGSLAVFVTETGTLESARNTSIKCKVEALLGQVEGLGSTGQGGTSKAGGTGSGSGGSGSGGSGSGSGGSGYGQGGSGGSGTGTGTVSKSKSSTKKKAGGSSSGSGASKSGSSTAKAGASGSGSSSGSASGSGSSSGSASASGSSSSSSSSTASSGSDSSSGVGKKPTIRSFSYQVVKHTPLRGEQKKATQTTKKDSSAMSGGGGGRGGRGGGGGGGGRGGGMLDEKPGSTRIIMIKPEGSEVAAGEVVCELDSASFNDELQAQLIKYAQAKAWVEQAKAIYEVNEITFREYRDGIYPQDLQLIKQYIESCRTDYDRAKKNEEWSRETANKGFRSSEQYKADFIEFGRAEMALKEAKGMEVRLVKFTGPRLLKSLEAKLKSIKSDRLAQEASFGIEDDRLRRLRTMIENCTLRAPREGVVVYANQSNPWSGQVQVQIQEGATVREGQTLFDLPDPKHMRVKVKINESKMAAVQAGQKAEIRIDAFPNQVLAGTVGDITPIPAVLGRFTDIRVYYANVDIDTGGFEGLRPGLTAEVSFLVDSRPKATRIPVQAVRWVGEQAFAAVAAKVDGDMKWDWRPITLGQTNATHAEVVDGLAPGEKVVAKPEGLTEPPLGLVKPALKAADRSADVRDDRARHG